MMTTTGPIRIGLAGLGRAGWGMHCEELKGREDQFQYVAGCDLLADRRQMMAERYGCAVYERIEDLVADPNVELVCVATRSIDHFAHVQLALEAGKDVFDEKPMCVSYQEAVALQELAATSKGKLYIRHNRRFEPAFQHIREIIDSGLLGEVYEVKLRRVHYARRDDWQTLREFGGGQLLNWGPHIVDHSLRLLGAPVKSVWSDLKRIAAVGDAEDHLKIVFTGENGRIVDMEISGGAAIGEPTYLIWGTKGALTSDERTITLRYLDPKTELPPRTADPGVPRAGFGSPEALPWVEETIPVQPALDVKMTSIWDYLYRTIREGEPFPITLDEAVGVMEVISAVRVGTPYEMEGAVHA
ncbi:MAG: Gfo/Idh/MocA family protein [Armatimonadota bacterium]